MKTATKLILVVADWLTIYLVSLAIACLVGASMLAAAGVWHPHDSRSPAARVEHAPVVLTLEP